MANDAADIRAALTTPERFGAVFNRHAAAIFSFVARRLGSGPAEDLTAEVFRIAFERRDVYDLSREDALPWLYGIATKLLLKHRSAQERQLRAYPREPRPEQAAADHAALVTESAATVVRAVLDLPPGEREVLLLFAWEELSYESIAQTLDIPIGTVRSRLNRARTRLRELRAQGEEEADVAAHLSRTNWSNDD